MSTIKRSFAIALLLGACRASHPSSSTPSPRVYVASGDGKIRVFAFDPPRLALVDEVAGGESTFLTFTKDRRFAYAVDETWDRPRVRAFAVDPKSGRLVLLDEVPAGATPTHVTLAQHDRFVLVANYTDGTVSVFRRAADGRLGSPIGTQSFGKDAETHEVVVDPADAFVLIANKGLDAIAVDAFDAGVLSALRMVPAGDGARHLAFHPSGKYVFAINEVASTIDAYRYDAGWLEALQSISTVPAAFQGANTGAEIAVAPSGRFVYASNRGHDSIAIFAVDPSTGKLALLRHVATGGKTPRHFSLDDAGRFLAVGNQDSGSIVIFAVDPETGDLTPVGAPFAVPAPAWVGFVSAK